MRHVAIDATGGDRAHAVGEFDLAKRPHDLGPVRPGECLCLNVNRGDDVVARLRICEIPARKIAHGWPIEEMMVCIHDRQIRLQDRLVASFQDFEAQSKSLRRHYTYSWKAFSRVARTDGSTTMTSRERP